ncbi:MAG TPA: cupin domain-containing protein [Nitrososphaeraceae archaeon]
MKSIYELDEILSELEEDKESYFVDFLNTENVEAGIIRLRKDQKDTQTAHSVDEIYHVIEGEGLISIQARNYAVKKGTCIFVPANVEHNFHGNKSDLTVFYVLTGK